MSIGSVGHWRDSVGGQLPSSTWTALSFATQQRLDDLCYDKPSNDVIKVNEPGNYLIIASMEYTGGTGPMTPRACASMLSGSGTLWTTYASGFMANATDNTAWTKVYAVYHGAAAGDTLQILHRRGVNVSGTGTKAGVSDVQIVKLDYQAVGMYRDTTGGQAMDGGYTWGLYLGATDLETNSALISKSSDTITIAANTNYLVIHTMAGTSGTTVTTSRQSTLYIDSVHDNNSLGHLFLKDVNNCTTGTAAMYIATTGAAASTLMVRGSDGFGTGQYSGGTALDGDWVTEAGKSGVCVIALNDMTDFMTMDMEYITPADGASPYNPYFNRVVTQGDNFTANSLGFKFANSGDLLVVSNIFSGRSDTAATTRFSGFANITIGGASQSTGKHGGFSRGVDGTASSLGESYNPGGVYEVPSTGTDILVTVQKADSTENGGAPYSLYGLLIALDLATLTDRVEPVITDADDEQFTYNETGVTITGTAFMAAQTTGKVELCDSDNYATANKVTQPVVSWSDTAIVINIDRGALTGTSFWLVVSSDFAPSNAWGVVVGTAAAEISTLIPTSSSSVAASFEKVIDPEIAQDLGSIGHWRDTSGGQIPTTAWTAISFNTQIRLDNSCYSKPDAYSISLDEMGCYLIIATVEYAGGTGFMSPQAKAAITTGNGKLWTSYNSGFMSDSTDNKAWVKVYAVYDGALAGDILQIQHRRGVDVSGTGTSANHCDVQVIKFSYAAIGMYRDDTGNQSLAGTGTWQVNLDATDLESDPTLVSKANSTITIAANTKYLVFHTLAGYSGDAVMTQRQSILMVDGSHINDSKSDLHFQNSNNATTGTINAYIAETGASASTLIMRGFTGSGTGQYDGGAALDGAWLSEPGKSGVCVIALNSSIDYTSMNMQYIQQIDSATPVEPYFNLVITQGTSFSANAKGFKYTKGGDLLVLANVFAARSDVTSTAKFTGFSSMQIGSSVESTGKHGAFTRGVDGTASTLGMSYNVGGFYELAPNEDIVVTAQKNDSTAGGGQPFSLVGIMLGIDVSTWTARVPPVIVAVGDGVFEYNEHAVVITGQAFMPNQTTGKVELCSSADYATSTKVGQVATAWSDTSIEVNFDRGALTSSQLWVVVSSDFAPSDAFEITMANISGVTVVDTLSSTVAATTEIAGLHTRADTLSSTVNSSFYMIYLPATLIDSLSTTANGYFKTVYIWVDTEVNTLSSSVPAGDSIFKLNPETVVNSITEAEAVEFQIEQLATEEVIFFPYTDFLRDELTDISEDITSTMKSIRLQSCISQDFISLTLNIKADTDTPQDLHVIVKHSDGSIISDSNLSITSTIADYTISLDRHKFNLSQYMLVELTAVSNIRLYSLDCKAIKLRNTFFNDFKLRRTRLNKYAVDYDNEVPDTVTDWTGYYMPLVGIQDVVLRMKLRGVASFKILFIRDSFEFEIYDYIEPALTTEELESVRVVELPIPDRIAGCNQYNLYMHFYSEVDLYWVEFTALEMSRLGSDYKELEFFYFDKVTGTDDYWITNGNCNPTFGTGLNIINEVGPEDNTLRLITCDGIDTNLNLQPGELRLLTPYRDKLEQNSIFSEPSTTGVDTYKFLFYRNRFIGRRSSYLNSSVSPYTHYAFNSISRLVSSRDFSRSLPELANSASLTTYYDYAERPLATACVLRRLTWV